MEAGGVVSQPVTLKRFNGTTKTLSLTYCDDTQRIGGKKVTECLQISTADLDADRDTDIVVAGKEGTQILFKTLGDTKK